MSLESNPIAKNRGLAATLSPLNTALTWLERILAAGAAAGILAIMTTVVVDVFGRYLFNRPLAWSYDLISIYLMPLVIFFALSDAFRRNQHITIELLYDSVSPLYQRMSRLLATVVIAAVMLPIAWLAFLQAANRYENKIVISGSILWPTWIPSLILAFGAGVLILRVLVDAAALINAMTAGLENAPGESPARQKRPENGVGDAI